MKTVFLCTPLKNKEVALDLIKRIKRAGARVLCAVTDTPQHLPPKDRFTTNVGLIKQSDIFVALLKDYGKDLIAEAGMAYAWGKTMIGVDYNLDPEDIMLYYTLNKVVKPDQLENALRPYLDN